jgi:hypothetical protein
MVYIAKRLLHTTSWALMCTARTGIKDICIGCLRVVMACDGDGQFAMVEMPTWEEIFPYLREMCSHEEDVERFSESQIIYNEILDALEMWMESKDICCICRKLPCP